MVKKGGTLDQSIADKPSASEWEIVRKREGKKLAIDLRNRYLKVLGRG